MKHTLDFDIDSRGHGVARFYCWYCHVDVWGRVNPVQHARWGTLGLDCPECLETMIAWDQNDEIVETQKLKGEIWQKNLSP